MYSNMNLIFAHVGEQHFMLEKLEGQRWAVLQGTIEPSGNQVQHFTPNLSSLT